MIGTDLNYAEQVLLRGGLVAIPTETVYGLAANALDTHAVSRIFEAKNRPHFDPLICHFSCIAAVEDLIEGITYMEKAILDRFSPGPITLLLPRPQSIPELVTSGSSLVGVRIPAHPVALALLERLPFPLAAPSANPFGYISPTHPKHVADQLGQKIDYILDGGPAEVGVESTVVQVVGNDGYILRPGGISLEELRSAFPTLTWSSSGPNANTVLASPGQLDSHYAPKKAIQLVTLANEPVDTPEKSMFIGFDLPSTQAYKHQSLLSETGDLAVAASNLFSILHEADDSDCDQIVAQLVPEVGLGRAINDRLRRAAAKRP